MSKISEVVGRDIGAFCLGGVFVEKSPEDTLAYAADVSQC